MSSYSLFFLPLLFGLLLDALIGDPHRLPHPVRLFGYLIAKLEGFCNRGAHRKLKGAIVSSSLVLLVFVSFYFFCEVLRPQPLWYILFTTIFFAYGISSRSLIDEAGKVEKALVSGDLPRARRWLSWIVGRDTDRLNEAAVRRATLETLAENLSDGVIAPLFFYLIGGLPLMMAYKMVNTLDSMIGYKNDRYRDFGWFAARILDDVANYIPSRLTAYLMVLLPYSPRGLSFIRRFGRAHSSPNSGFPEAALAGILDCRFGGPNYYHGRLVDKPYIGENPRGLTHADFLKAVRINLRTALWMSILMSLAGYFLY